MTAHRFCHHCGAEYPDTDWPRKCSSCTMTVWRNPTPVAVAMVPVRLANGEIALLAGRRNIEPMRFKLAMPGGFIEFGESWNQAAARELREETGILTDPSSYRIFDVATVPGVSHMLMFCVTEPIDEAILYAFVPNAETISLETFTSPDSLAFPLHAAAARRWLTEQGIIAS